VTTFADTEGLFAGREGLFAGREGLFAGTEGLFVDTEGSLRKYRDFGQEYTALLRECRALFGNIGLFCEHVLSPWRGESESERGGGGGHTSA